ncbi:MAG: hypothetical protein JWM53_6556, partial [bacterium]|nr:hypothetical protein [bacterium]
MMTPRLSALTLATTFAGCMAAAPPPDDTATIASALAVAAKATALTDEMPSPTG